MFDPVIGMRTDSPDNDSAFSDTVSMLSSESSASSSGSGHKPPQTAMHTAPQQQSHQFVGESLIYLRSITLECWLGYRFSWDQFKY